jgi:head-tail adaptor
VELASRKPRGELRHVITIENPLAKVIDEHGEYTTPYAFATFLMASIEGPPREEEAVTGSVERAAVTHVVEMDYHPLVTRHSRIVLESGRILYVRGLVDLEERHVRLVASCEERGT